MTKIKSKTLFDLIKSLSKNEKRYFKVLVSNSSEAEDKKIILLFDLISNSEDLNKEINLTKSPSIKAAQIPNLKAYLFEKILQVLRMYHTTKIKDIQIREQIDYIQILIERRLYTSAQKCIDKAKKMAQTHLNLELQLEILKIEKSLVMQNISDVKNNVDNIVEEVQLLNQQINNINTFTNLSIKLNSFYTKSGFIRDEKDDQRIKDFFNKNISYYQEQELSIAEKINLYRLYIGYYFFLQDFNNGYIYSKKLEEIFESEQPLIENMPDEYIKALNNLLIAQYKLFLYTDFVATNQKLQSITSHPKVRINENIRIKLLKYFYTHEINKFFMTGDFNSGVEIIINQQGKELNLLIMMLDKHSSLILNYKIACLHFGAGNYSQSIKTLHKIINSQEHDLREDLHCFARIMNLVCHYELKNFDVIKHYIISTYRFLLKKDDLRLFQKYVLKFLKNLSLEMDNKDLLFQFQELKNQLTTLIDSPYEKRAFIYFDIISWLESKIEKKSVQEIIQQKFHSRITKES
ncbi:MAG: hypothetical protein EAZ07_02645 [Cytophagales bacterium]|nr:MAG: hypothetical protein EAZ07_02645 [Cytophagales bacterium]